MPRSAQAVALPPPDAAALTAHPALDLLDEAFHRLRLAPLSLLGVYYLGTLPFVLALLYFWTDQSRDPDANAHAIGGAGFIALLFLGMKTAQAVYAARLSARLRGQPAPDWTWGRLGRLALVQSILQPPGLFVLGLPSLLLAFTTDQNSTASQTGFVVLLGLFLSLFLGWPYAFYQNVTAFGDGTTAATGPVFRRAWRGALHRPKQNHAGLTLLSLLGLFVTLNLLLVLVGVPYLLKMFTGEENLFTRNGFHLINTTFFLVLTALVYLALDPLAKAFYVLRCFYEDSLKTGEDLLSELAALPPPAISASTSMDASTPDREPTQPAPFRSRPVSAAGMVTLLGLAAASLALPLSPLRAAAAPPPLAPPAASPAAGQAPRSVSPPVLRQSIDDVLARRQFAWRLPHKEDKAPEQAGALDGFFKRIGEWFSARWKSVEDWFRAVRDWWRKRHPDRDLAPEPASSNSFSFLGLASRPVLIGLAVALGGVIAYLLWRQWQGRRAPVATGKPVSAGAAPVPDLTDDTVLATQLPEDEWLRLAQGLMERGERRLALRAFYLSALSNLATRGLLAIARHKSNRDYLQELRRRARVEPASQEAFGRNVARFERVWYGAHPADDALLADFQTDRQRVLG